MITEKTPSQLASPCPPPHPLKTQPLQALPSSSLPAPPAADCSSVLHATGGAATALPSPAWLLPALPLFQGDQGREGEGSESEICR